MTAVAEQNLNRNIKRTNRRVTNIPLCSAFLYHCEAWFKKKKTGKHTPYNQPNTQAQMQMQNIVGFSKNRLRAR